MPSGDAQTLTVKYYPNFIFIFLYVLLLFFFYEAFKILPKEERELKILSVVISLFLLFRLAQSFTGFGRKLILKSSGEGIITIINKSFFNEKKTTVNAAKISTIWVYKKNFLTLIISKSLLCTYSKDRGKMKLAEIVYNKGAIRGKHIYNIINFFVQQNKEIAF